jgi:hypothetical protein
LGFQAAVLDLGEDVDLDGARIWSAHPENQIERGTRRSTPAARTDHNTSAGDGVTATRCR